MCDQLVAEATAYTTHNRRTSMPSVVFEHASQQTSGADLLLSPHGQRDRRGKAYCTLLHSIFLICYYSKS